jgi:hypothetical protein
MAGRYAEQTEVQRAVNLSATGMTDMGVAQSLNRPYATVNGWLRPGGLAARLGLTANLEKEIEPPPEKLRIRVKASASPEGAVTRVLAIGDAHDCPSLSKDRFRWMGALANERGVDWIVQIGDFGSFDSLSSHIPNDTLAGKLKNPYHHDVQSLNEAMGALSEGLAGHKPKLHCTMGNHERRVWLFENQRPEVSGMLTGELLQTFADHGWTTTEYGEYFFLAGTGFVHAALNRLGKTYGGKNSENTIANDAIFDHVIGHSHVKRDVRAPKLGPSKHVTILNLGCALPQGHVEEYIYHGALSGWWWGCCVLTLQGGQIVGVDALPMSELERRFA